MLLTSTYYAQLLVRCKPIYLAGTTRLFFRHSGGFSQQHEKLAGCGDVNARFRKFMLLASGQKVSNCWSMNAEVAKELHMRVYGTVCWETGTNS